MSSTRSADAGFSLVEVALALLVASVGLTAIFGLFPAAASANRRAIQDTQIGLFAEYVMNGIRWRAEQMEWSAVTDDGSFSIAPLVGTYGFDNPDDVIADRNRVAPIAYRSKSAPEIEEMAFRYQIRIEDLSPARKSVTLFVWPGQYGVLSETNVFYTEIFNSRG